MMVGVPRRELSYTDFRIQLHKNDEMTFFRRERERGSLDETVLHWLGYSKIPSFYNRFVAVFQASKFSSPIPNAVLR